MTLPEITDCISRGLELLRLFRETSLARPSHLQRDPTSDNWIISRELMDQVFRIVEAP